VRVDETAVISLAFGEEGTQRFDDPVARTEGTGDLPSDGEVIVEEHPAPVLGVVARDAAGVVEAGVFGEPAAGSDDPGVIVVGTGGEKGEERVETSLPLRR